MKRIMVAAGIVLGLCVAYAAAHLALIEGGREVVVLHKWTSGGAVHKTRLWIVDEGRYSWLHHGYADSEWIRRLATDPIVTIERDGRTRQYRAMSDPESHRRVHELLREKYGIADLWVRFVTGGTERCPAVPVRLELLERANPKMESVWSSRMDGTGSSSRAAIASPCSGVKPGTRE